VNAWAGAGVSPAVAQIRALYKKGIQVKCRDVILKDTSSDPMCRHRRIIIIIISSSSSSGTTTSIIMVIIITILLLVLILTTP
jgi:hypothetical protein